MEVRRGEVPLEEVLERLSRRAVELERACLDPALAEEPDRDRVDAFLLSAYRGAWAD